MTESRYRLELRTPTRSPPGPDAFDVTPKRVKAWVESLPIANTGETARLLFEALKQVNFLDVQPAHRYGFLEHLRKPVDHLSATLERHYMGKSFPLSPREQKLAELSQEFQLLMAQGYEILLEDLASGSGPALVLKRRMVGVTIHRAIRYLSRTLLKSYQLYAPYPDNVWRDIHQLYRFAIDAHLDHREILDEHNSLVPKTSIARAYKQILLLALCSPYQLRQGDVVRVFTALERWAAHCRLKPIYTPSQFRQGLFGVPADIDDQPKYLDLATTAQTTRLEWVLDTGDLGGVLRSQLEYLSKPHDDDMLWHEEIPPDISPHLLQRVMQSLGMMQNRGHARIDRAGRVQVEVALGLSAIHFVISGGPLQEQTADAEEEETELSEARSPFPWAAHALRKVKPETVLCGVGDEGAGGYRLLWPGDSPVKAHVGAILGIRRTEDVEDWAQWRIGVVRWMRAADEARLEVGVQMVAPFARHIWIRVRNAQGQCGERIESLLLPPVAAAGRRENIVGPAFLDNFGKGLLVREGGGERTVRFTRVLENTGSFAQFEFEAAPEEAESEDLSRRIDDDAPEADDDFDSLWSSL